MTDWVDICSADDVDEEDVIAAEYNGQSIAIYRSPEDEFYATSGLCTHENVLLADGLVMGDIIECPKHNGQFNYKTGEAKRLPACEHLITFAVKVIDGRVMIKV